MDIGKHFIVGLNSTKLNNEEKKQITELQPLGFIFFNRNFETKGNWQEKFINLLNELRALVKRDTIIFSIDHEGGRVNRLPAPVTAFPYAREYINFSKDVALVFSRELGALGLNLCFAPVLDTDLEPSNKVISKRAFSTNISEVTTAAIEFAINLESHGLQSCGKHFPGHGATIADSHFELPINKSNVEELLNNEIKPFAAYINAGFRLIMSSHILFPNIDPDLPATLSKKIISGILREQLKFDGCVITDDLDMKALDQYPNKGLKAAEAGVDILLIGGIGQSTALTTALELKKQIEKIDLRASSKRIDHLIEHINTLPKPNTDLSVIGCAQHLALLKKLN